MSAGFAVGPLRIARCDVTITTTTRALALAAERIFADLAADPASMPADRTVAFDVIERAGERITWSVFRDGEPCELELRDDAVLVHLQWELNRLAIETQPTSIHAAAVAVDARAALLIGDTHSGKTTLAGWLVARHGADYVDDEVAAIDADGAVLRFPRPLGVRPDSPLATLNAPGGSAGWRDAATRFMRDERLVPVGDLGGSRRRVATPVVLLVFPTYEPNRGVAVRHLDQADAFERVAALTPGLGRHGRPVFERLCMLVEQAPAVEILHGGVDRAAPAVIEALDRGAPR